MNTAENINPFDGIRKKMVAMLEKEATEKRISDLEKKVEELNNTINAKGKFYKSIKAFLFRYE